jgi:pSer/pThr/pTyr-binding forkhead associated (FHA) protein
MTTYILHIREPGKPERSMTLEGTIDAGREVGGLRLADEQVSRHHLRFAVEVGGLSVMDLGSTNGTSINGSRITEVTRVADGDRIEVGDTVIGVSVLNETEAAVESGSGPASMTTAPYPVEDKPPAPPSVPPPPPPPPPPPSRPRPAPPGASDADAKPPPALPVLEELASRSTDAAVVRYVPGTAGERAASGVARAAKQARKNLAGLGSEPWGALPTICLVDPLPDPDQPGAVMTS